MGNLKNYKHIRRLSKYLESEKVVSEIFTYRGNNISLNNIIK